MIYLGCDHGGFALKEAIRSHLEKQGLAVTDCGNTTFDSEDDFTTFVTPVVNGVLSDVNPRATYQDTTVINIA